MFQFQEKVVESLGEAWSDGKLVIRPIYVTHQWKQWTKYRFFLAGQEETEARPMNMLFGFNQGPPSEDKHWSLRELDIVLQEWSNDIPTDLEEDLRIVESIRVLLHGCIPNGITFTTVSSRVRGQILYQLHELIVCYMSRHTPMSEKLANDLSQQLFNLSF